MGSREVLEKKDKLGTDETFEARIRGALSPFWGIIAILQDDSLDAQARMIFLEDALKDIKKHQDDLLELLEYSGKDRKELSVGDEVALKCIQLTTQLNYGSKTSMRYLNQAKKEINKKIEGILKIGKNG